MKHEQQDFTIHCQLCQSWSVPAFLLPWAQGCIPPPSLSPCDSLQWRHAVLIESDPDSSFFQTTLADAPLFSPPPAVDNWPFGCGTLQRELWPHRVSLSPVSLCIHNIRSKATQSGKKLQTCTFSSGSIALKSSSNCWELFWNNGKQSKKKAVLWLLNVNLTYA